MSLCLAETNCFFWLFCLFVSNQRGVSLLAILCLCSTSEMYQNSQDGCPATKLAHFAKLAKLARNGRAVQS